MSPQSQRFLEPPRRPCCRPRLPLVLLGMLTALLWAGLLTLLLLWHWDTERNLRQLEDSAARNVSQVSKDLHRYQSDQMAQKSQAAQLSRNVERLQAQQTQLESQGERRGRGPGQTVGGTAPEPQGTRPGDPRAPKHHLNERRAASDSLEKLQEEVAKLWMEILASKGTTCNTCPEGWLHFRQKCYYFGQGAKRWVQARFTCDDLEGRLVSIHSQEEQDFLTKRANKRGSWIGLRDLDLEGEFIWMDGSPLDYSNWNLGEPNNGDQGEDCVMMLGSGKWNDASCRGELDAWVCEQLATCGPPAPSASGDVLEPAPTEGH
uniref:Fc epsilon receptor II n=1 Tax=Ictidomys tridecemlineatus TaxID=43179 RepID=I3MWG4_ICTTR